MYPKEIFWDNTYWIRLTLFSNQMETAVNKVENTRDSTKYSKFLEQPSDC